MSVRAQNWVWGLALPPTAKLILLALADHADEADESWPSLRSIASRCNVSERTVQRTLKDFEHRQLLSVNPRFAKDGRQRSNVYLLAISGPPDKLSPSPQSGQGEGDTHVTRGVSQLCRREGDTGGAPGATQHCRGEGDTATSPREPQQESNIESPQQPELRWPRSLAQDQVAGIQRLIAGLDHGRAQALLAELGEALRVPGTIRTTPVRWVAGLVRIQAQGGFVPSIPPRSKQDRAAAKGSEVKETPTVQAGPSPEVRAQLRNVVDSIKKRTGQRDT